jgi:hypothetical protein
MKILLIIILFGSLIACDMRQPDQKLRREIFMECLEKIPAGPQEAKYNDWDDVVDECGTQAYYISIK